MKSVLISVHPKWCEKILSGEKTIEVRKSAPKEVPFKVYIYCTKSGDRLVLKSDKYFAPSKLQTGKVIGEFICDKVVEIEVFNNGAIENYWFYNLDKSCLSFDEMVAYIGKGNIGYGWHISDLKIYDKPRELSEFYRECEKPKCEGCPYFYVVNTPNSYETYCEVNEKLPITRPPQSWQYVEELK